MNISFFKKNHSFIFFLSTFLLSIFLLCGCQNKKEVYIPKNIDELDGKKITVLLGSTQDLTTTEHCPNSEIMRLNSFPEMLVAVEKGIADYAVLDSAIVVGANIYNRGMQVDFCLNDFMPVASAFRFDEKDLCQQYNDFIAEINKNGLNGEMRKRWLTDNALTEQIPVIDMPTSGKPIRIGTMYGNFPLSFIKNGQWAGYEIELMYRFSTYIGRPVEITAYEFSALLPALSVGKIDMITCFMSITEERSQSVLFSDPYYLCQSICVGQASKNDIQSNSGLWSNIKEGFHNNIIAEKRWKLILDGLWETIYISFFSILIGTVIGCFICALRMSHRKLWRGIAIGYIEIMRGIPILVFLMVMFYIVFAPTRVTATWVAIIAFAMNFGAYVSEMFRTSIESVDHGQVEAGRALGFSRNSTFVNFVLPQAVRKIFPIYKGEAISLIKNTSVVGYIAIQDITKASDIIRSRTFDAFFPLLIITIIYFLLAWLLGLGLDYLNKKTTHP